MVGGAGSRILTHPGNTKSSWPPLGSKQIAYSTSSRQSYTRPLAKFTGRLGTACSEQNQAAAGLFLLAPLFRQCSDT